jgi:hypothetical protein
MTDVFRKVKYLLVMKNIYRKTEKGFEKLTSVAMAILGNPSHSSLH